MSKPCLPAGTRDFGPDVVRKRSYILDTIRSAFQRYGYQPLETPAFENLETLMGKYGDEGDKLIFKILNNGLDHPDKEKKLRAAFDTVLQGKNSVDLTERALKYDLTIPFARYVAMNHGQLTFPFKRYQIQPVWRADRPQKGRYREFYQCDADVVGSRSLLYEAELACLYHDVFTELKLAGYQLQVNHRSLLLALAELCGNRDWLLPITVAIDKLDKIGWEKVKLELEQKQLPASAIEQIHQYLSVQGNAETVLRQLDSLLGHLADGRAGLAALREWMRYLSDQPVAFRIDPTLARGLNYYTGLIFEVKAPASASMGSIGGGGRYDDLTGLFGVPNIPGVGISFGVDRIYDVMEALDLFPINITEPPRVLFFNLGITESAVTFALMQELRNKGISADMYPEPVKLDKQFKYAEKKGFLYVAILGESEMQNQTIQLKNLQTGTQQTLNHAEFLNIQL
ncbi:MAG: histidine--tRNA ligase [Bacteroidetes bacterium]|nr:histidine--tRNA ligase [Bacteroidota bacterium]